MKEYLKEHLTVSGTKMVLSGWSAEGFDVEIPFLKGGSFSGIYNCDDGHYMIYSEGIEQEVFKNYCESLLESGCELCFQNEIGDNLFYTYRKDGILVHAYWISHSKEARILFACTDLLPVKESVKQEDVCTTLFHQMQATDEMGYIIRLCDGRFIVIDGGWKKEENADAIYSFLKEYAPNSEKIVIAAWYITHAHADHGGGMVAFAQKYGKDESIVLERILFHPCDTPEQMMYCRSITAELRETFRIYYPNVPVYKPLTGQIYIFGKTRFEILYAMCDFLPRTIPYEVDGKGGDYNVQSMVSIIDLDYTREAKDKVFLMGDTTARACNEMCKRYGDYMKCDYVQISHHGLLPLPTGPDCRRRGATMEIYDYIDAPIVLWPTSEEIAKNRISCEANQHVCSKAEKVVIAGKGARTFEI